MLDVVPSQTLYASNLNGKTKKQELKRALHLCFSAFGRVLDVVCLKTPKLRGQAWVVFADVPAATNALRALQGFNFYDRPLGKSDVIAKADGSWLPKHKRVRGPQPAERGKRVREGEEEEDDEEAPAAAGAAAPAGEANAILFLEGLPEATTAAMLTLLFKQFPGFVEVRMVEAKPGIAFVEFESELHSGGALAGLNGFKISQTHSLHITYALKSKS